MSSEEDSDYEWYIKYAPKNSESKSRYLEMKDVKSYRKNFMKPRRDPPMKRKDKNIWIVGDKDKLEQFIHDAIGDNCLCVYCKDDVNYWDGYANQPFIVFRLYDKSDRNKIFYDIKYAGDYNKRPIDIRWTSGMLNPDKSHSIVLSTFTPEEYFKGMKDKQNMIKTIKRLYDELKI